MSPHILIDEALESLKHPSSTRGEVVLVQQMITKMMTDELITLEEFSHYCSRLLRHCQKRKEAA
ncbi:Uncharacterized protein ALO57_00156 [Pseudomonas coronafaciens pv. oryzae]|uniref:hypothetical protein n=1 Tax=Pseudomonas coronafaciens TaxID=53409 RepID=UPI0006B67E0B|nr:hypothetical protein [Pseudomonas coronafaciens]KPB51343.1 Uncharacterized protein AC511_1501 [Pseudomonas coronafaciens pv. oryzae]KPY06226.1 Uncharacterized protein ALO57_00156 [Pseudomonas coronafaciens pv. oryzae]RMT01719.1 hypothetical protein ALP55_03203 [Pseudomonas coronafaciens pv. oryzae]